MIKLFTHGGGGIRLLNSKSTDLDWYYSRPYGKLKLLIRKFTIHDLCEKPSSKQRFKFYVRPGFQPLIMVKCKKLQCMHIDTFNKFSHFLHLSLSCNSQWKLLNLSVIFVQSWNYIYAQKPNDLKISSVHSFWTQLCFNMNLETKAFSMRIRFSPGIWTLA